MSFFSNPLRSIKNAVSNPIKSITNEASRVTGDLGSLAGKYGLPLALGAVAGNPALAIGLLSSGALAGSGLLGSGSSSEGAQKSPFSEDQLAYFNRPSQGLDWAKLGSDASASGVGLGQYIAQNWNNFGNYKTTTPTQYQQPIQQPAQRISQYLQMPQYAHGGLHLVNGNGTGRSDNVNALLSPGEYVMDAESVSMLGDGSTQAGAKRLDQMREKLRKHKGGALSKGRFSPDAKAPLSYLKGK